MRASLACWVLPLATMNSCGRVEPLSLPSSPSAEKIRTYRHPGELHAELMATLDDTATSCAPPSLWNTVLPRRLASVAAEEGTWIANGNQDGDGANATTSCVAQVIPPGNVYFFHREQAGVCRESIQAILQAAVGILSEGGGTDAEPSPTRRLVLKFGALDRKLLPCVKTTLKEGHVAQRKFSSIYTSQCGMWVYEGTAAKHQSLAGFSKDLPKGATIRPLRREDAPLVNERWEYKSHSSLDTVRRMIRLSEETFGGCVGLFADDVLVSWICRYLDGTLGMLFTEREHRNRGYAGLVVTAAVSDCCRKRSRRDDGVPAATVANIDGRMVSYIVDSNHASQRLYTKLGWRRVADADWVGFACRKRTKDGT